MYYDPILFIKVSIQSMCLYLSRFFQSECKYCITCFIKTLSAIKYEWPTNLQWEPKAGLLSQDVMQSFHNKFYYERGFSCWAKNRTSELKIELIMNRVLTCSHTQRGKVGHSGHRSCQSKPWESTDWWESTSDLSITRIIYCTIQYKKVHGKWVICQNWNWFMTLALLMC